MEELELKRNRGRERMALADGMALFQRKALKTSLPPVSDTPLNPDWIIFWNIADRCKSLTLEISCSSLRERNELGSVPTSNPGEGMETIESCTTLAATNANDKSRPINNDINDTKMARSFSGRAIRFFGVSESTWEGAIFSECRDCGKP